MIAHRIKNETIVINHDPRVAQTVPHAKAVSSGAKMYLLVPHRPTEVKLLNNLGYNINAPILDNYDWCGHRPFVHQMDTAALLTTSHRAYVLSSMGVGKTLAAMFAMDYLLRIREIRKVLVVCPLSVVSGVWESEIFRWMPHLRVAILHGTKSQRLKALKADADVYVINHDGVHTILKELKAKKGIDFVLVDELSAYRNARTRRWKALKAVTEKVKYVHGMTGTPMVKAPTDAYGQAKLITPENVTPYFKAFQNQTMYQVSQFTWRPRQDALETVYKTLQPAIRVTLNDCSDIPDTVYTTREVEMTPDQKRSTRR
jgi:SNF2 family DNA or RNA helicase